MPPKMNTRQIGTKETLASIESKLSPDGKLIVTAIVNEITSLEARLKKKFDDDLSKLSEEFQEAINKKDEEITAIKADLNEARLETKTLQDNVSQLTAKLDALDAYQRRDCVIFSGNKIPASVPNENCATIIRDLVRNELSLQIDPPISTAHRLGRPPAPNSTEPDTRDIIVKFCQRDVKNSVYSAARRQKIDGLYVNESLTVPRRKIMAVLRQIVKKHRNLVSSCTTNNGNCYVYTLPAPNAPQNSRYLKTEINSMHTLSEFCSNFIKKPLQYFLDIIAARGRRSVS